jgi:thymidylate synthase
LALHEYISSNGYEKGFLKTLETVLTEGFRTDDRTGVGCLTLPGQKIEYDLSGGKFPLMTTRRAFFRGIVEECLWILSGSTDARVLQEKDIHVWDGNSSREFLDSRGLQHLEEGDIGAGYGFQLRNFGADYSGCRAVPDAAAGVDQLRNLIEGIRTDPNGRRHIISLWNPAAIRNTALPPCHVLYQWIVDTTRHELHCCFYQRSSDLFIAGNWNACSAALMTYLIGHITGYIPRRVVMMIGSAHIYTNHIQQVKEQLTREPRHFPLLRIRRAPSFSAVNFDNYCFEDFELVGYEPMPAIKAPMNV